VTTEELVTELEKNQDTMPVQAGRDHVTAARNIATLEFEDEMPAMLEQRIRRLEIIWR
jgi:hypothetical protein